MDISLGLLLYFKTIFIRVRDESIFYIYQAGCKSSFMLTSVCI
jgi:hypothetical protein